MQADLAVILPEIALSVYAMAALLVTAYTGKDRMAGAVNGLTAAVLVLVALWIGLSGAGEREAFGGMIVDDAFSRFARVAALLAAATTLAMGGGYMERHGFMRFEYPVLIALAAVGMMVMVSAGDLMALYMGLELQSLALYVAAAMRRDSARSTEAGLKYFVLGALSSGLLLYGASLTYGYAGTTLFSGIREAVGGEAPIGLLIGLVLVVSGLAFKVSAAPFHMWTPDVYEGAPTPVTAFFATAPKIAAMALFARVVHDAYGGAVGDWRQVVAALSAISMFLGSIAAIGQSDLKRLMAYSSIAHSGYALMGLAAGTALGVQAMLVYMCIYAATNAGVFAFILSMERDGRPETSIASLNMLAKAHPARALALLALLFSLAGVPPLLGFLGKFHVLRAAFDGGLAWLAVAGVVASAIGAFYYLRIVYLMYFGGDGESPSELQIEDSPVRHGLMMAAALITLVGIVNMFGVDGLAEIAAAALVAR